MLKFKIRTLDTKISEIELYSKILSNDKGVDWFVLEKKRYWGGTLPIMDQKTVSVLSPNLTRFIFYIFVFV